MTDLDQSEGTESPSLSIFLEIDHVLPCILEANSSLFDLGELKRVQQEPKKKQRWPEIIARAKFDDNLSLIVYFSVKESKQRTPGTSKGGRRKGGRLGG